MRPDLRQGFALHVALGQIATLPFVVAGVAMLEGGLGDLYSDCCGHGLLDPGGFIRGVGVARRDQPVGEARNFLLPYAPECVESLSEKPHQRAESLSIRLG